MLPPSPFYLARVPACVQPTSDWLDGAVPGATLSGTITGSYPTTRCAMLSDFSFATRNATSTQGLVMWHGCSET